MGGVSITVIAGLVAIQGYALQAAATSATNCPFFGSDAAFSDPGGPVSRSAVGNPGDATSNEGATPTLVLSPDGRLSVDMEGVSLECVLQELGRQGEVTVRVNGPTANDAVWRQFRDLSLYEGVRLLLEGKSYVLFHAGPANSGDGSEVERVLAIFVMRSGSGRFGWDEEFADTAARDRPPAEAQNVPETTSFADRVADLERLAERNMARFSDVLLQTLRSDDIDDEALPDLALALFDDIDGVDDEALRELALALFDDIDGVDGQPPAEVLAAMIAAAPTARLRREALALLAEVSQELSFGALMQAIGDPDPAISGLAEELYAELYAGLRLEAVIEAVERAVQDDDWRVRHSALATLEDMQEFAPVGQLAALAANDPNPEVRMRALELVTLGDRQAAIDTLELALTDPNPKISELAEDLLEDLEQDLS